MKLSSLQKYILLQCFDSKNKLDRKCLVGFYNSARTKHQYDIMINSITSSLDRLIQKSLLVGFGEITKKKIYINKIRLTREGRSMVKKLLGEQKSLPFKIRK